jgi:hypothetical protein
LSTGSKELLAQYGSKLAKLSSRKFYDLAAVPALLALLQRQECLREVTIFKAEIILPCFFPAIASGRLRCLRSFWLNGELIPTCSIVPLAAFLSAFWSMGCLPLLEELCVAGGCENGGVAILMKALASTRRRKRVALGKSSPSS